MKKSLGAIFLIVILAGCGPRSDQVDRIVENGVEVVLNHVTPYRVAGEALRFRLEREYSVDFGGDEIAGLGLAGAVNFEIDSEGSVYFFEANKQGDLIFKFDPRGRFQKSFGRKGQGPGEMNDIVWTGVDERDRVVIADNGNRKNLAFSKDGALLQEIKFAPDLGLQFPLENGNFAGLWDKRPGDSPRFMYSWVFSLYDPAFKEIKRLDSQKVYDFNTQGMRGTNARPFFKLKIGRGYIYVMSEDRGYEILVYDRTGRLVRKIRKEFAPVAISEGTIAERKKQYEQMGEAVWFSKHWLPVRDFFIDGAGRIFALTFEKAARQGESVCDIFNPDGIFAGRIDLNISTPGDAEACVKAKNGRLYCFREKPDGFREFVVSRMIWE
jgi:hypothetical protein